MNPRNRSQTGRSHERAQDADDLPAFYVVRYIPMHGYPVVERFHGDPVAFFVNERDAQRYARWRCLTHHRDGSTK